VCRASRSGVGGIPEIIWNGVNGFIQTGEGRIERFRDIVLDLWQTPMLYARLHKAHIQTFQNALNWCASGRKVLRFG
jgi:hypothetical protein